MVFSEKLKALRSEKKLSQSLLAKEVGVSAGNIGDWESGRSKPGYAALYALARYFNVSADYLLDLSTEQAPINLEKSAPQITGFSKIETNMISMFRLLSASHKEEIFELICFKFKRETGEGDASIFSAYADEMNEQNKASTREQNIRIKASNFF